MRINRIKILFISCTILISCSKNANNNVPNLPQAIEMPDTIIQLQYEFGNNRLYEKSVFTFPQGMSESKIDYFELDSFFSAGYFTTATKNHTEYAFDPITRHLLSSSSRTVALFNRDTLNSNLNGNWDNSFDYLTGEQYPDAISITNYDNYLLANPRQDKFTHDMFSPEITYDRPGGNGIPSFQILLNDSGAVHLIDLSDGDNWYLFQNTLPGYHAGANDEYRYFFDKNSSCWKFIYQNGFIQTVSTGPFSAIDFFQPTAELRSNYTYSSDSTETKKLFGAIFNTNDLFWNRIAVSRSSISFKKEPFYIPQITCESYSDSLFTLGNNNVRNFYSVHTHKNVISRDQKNRIISIARKYDTDFLGEEFDFIYTK